MCLEGKGMQDDAIAWRVRPVFGPWSAPFSVKDLRFRKVFGWTRYSSGENNCRFPHYHECTEDFLEKVEICRENS